MLIRDPLIFQYHSVLARTTLTYDDLTQLVFGKCLCFGGIIILSQKTILNFLSFSQCGLLFWQPSYLKHQSLHYTKYKRGYMLLSRFCQIQRKTKLLWDDFFTEKLKIKTSFEKKILIIFEWKSTAESKKINTIFVLMICYSKLKILKNHGWLQKSKHLTNINLISFQHNKGVQYSFTFPVQPFKVSIILG